MTKKRKSIPIEVRKLVLHESGYKCASPACRSILTLDIHHLDYVSDGGSDNADNLLPLCPNCHSLHHQGHIPIESLRAWKMLLLSLNEGFDRKSIDMLLALDKLSRVFVSGDGVLDCAVLIASGLVDNKVHNPGGNMRFIYEISLSDKGRFLVDAWKQGNQDAAVNRDNIASADGF